MTKLQSLKKLIEKITGKKSRAVTISEAINDLSENYNNEEYILTPTLDYTKQSDESYLIQDEETKSKLNEIKNKISQGIYPIVKIKYIDNVYTNIEQCNLSIINDSGRMGVIGTSRYISEAEDGDYYMNDPNQIIVS